MTDSPIFIVGCPRSGTSMLRDLLRSHPRLSFPPESHFIPALYRAWGDPSSDRQAVAIGRRILSLNTIRLWQLDLAPSAFARCRSFAAVLDLLFGTYARGEGRERWGDKTPQQVAELPLLLELFPRAKVIHIYRDGRDVAHSWVGRRFGPRNVFAAATEWKRLVAAGRRDGRALGGAYAEVRYEALLEQPEETMRGLCEFIDERYSGAVLEPAPRSPLYAPNEVAKGTFRQRTEIERRNHGKWRGEMPPSERAIFESVAGELLAELGYVVEELARPISRPGRARMIADNAVRVALSRMRVRQFTLRNLLVLAHAWTRARFR